MIVLKKILVPTDFSEHSDKAIRYGVELAAKFNSELHVFHAVEAIPIMYGEGGGYFSYEATKSIEDAAAEHLESLEINAPEGVNIVRKVVPGHPFVEIVRYARENAMDLLVIGTHGRGAISHMLLGSVAERVTRKAPCPVLVVREEEHEFVVP